jgi:hypothetical protein
VTVDTTVVHVALAAALFILLSWLGHHSLSSGYLALSAFVRTDEAPAFNLVFRVLGPIVFVTLSAALLYWLGLDRHVVSIWMVTTYYCLGRLFYIVLFDRLRLVNWPREALIWIATIGGSWVIYDPLISAREHLLPEIKDLKNQFWILIIMFLYATFNNVRLRNGRTVERKRNYLVHAYSTSREEHGKVIAKLTQEPLPESIAYAVLMYEQFNRPQWIRRIERMLFPFGSRSLGPMQVTTTTRLSDADSVDIGVQRLMQLYSEALADGNTKAAAKGLSFDAVKNSTHRQFVIYRVASGYNKDDDYLSGVQEMHHALIDLRYPALKFHSEHWSEHLV